MRKNKKWTYSEIQYMKEVWGSKSIKAIAKKLNRTTNAIKIKAYKLKLKRLTDYGEYITFNQFVNLINKPSYIRYNKKLINAGFPLKTITIVTKKINVLYMSDFWKWLENNIHLIDLQYTEKGMLGPEPDWVYYKKDADIRAAEYTQKPWSAAEDKRLINLLSSYNYGYREISIKLKRTEGAIKRRMLDLKIKSRPLKADNHNPWKKSEIDTVRDLYLKGYKSQIIAEYIDRSALAINGLIERHNFFKERIKND